MRTRVRLCGPHCCHLQLLRLLAPHSVHWCAPTQAAAAAKQGLLSLGKALTGAQAGEGAMALRESHLTRLLIGSVEQVGALS